MSLEEKIKELEINAAIIKYKELNELMSHEEILEIFKDDGGIMEIAAQKVISEKLLASMRDMKATMDNIHERMFVNPEQKKKQTSSVYLKYLNHCKKVEEFLEENDAIYDRIERKFKKR